MSSTVDQGSHTPSSERAPDGASGATAVRSTVSRDRARRRLALAARLALSIGLLWLLVTRIGGGSARLDLPPVTGATVLWLTGAASLTLVAFVLSAVRWHTVLAALGQESRLCRLLSHYLAGQFVANVMPTTIGGDLVRVNRQSRDSGESPTSFASVVLERMSGWLVLPVITFIGLAVNPGLRHLREATQLAVGLAAVTLALLVAVLVAVANRRWSDTDATKGWRRFLAAVSLGVNRLRDHPGQAANVVLVGFAYQLALVLAAVLAAEALGIPAAGPTALLAFFPAVAIAQVLPISISGLGVREGLFALFLGPLGVPVEQAVALGLVLYLLTLIVSLLGAPAFAVGAGTRSRPAPG